MSREELFQTWQAAKREYATARTPKNKTRVAATYAAWAKAHREKTLPDLTPYESKYNENAPRYRRTS